MHRILNAWVRKAELDKSRGGIPTYVLACVMAILLVQFLETDVRNAKYVLGELSQIAPKMPQDRALWSVLEEAEKRIDESQPVLVFSGENPFFYTYYLYPRPTYYDPALRSEAAWEHEMIQRREIRWLVGDEIRWR